MSSVRDWTWTASVRSYPRTVRHAHLADDGRPSAHERRSKRQLGNDRHHGIQGHARDVIGPEQTPAVQAPPTGPGQPPLCPAPTRLSQSRHVCPGPLNGTRNPVNGHPISSSRPSSRNKPVAPRVGRSEGAALGVVRQSRAIGCCDRGHERRLENERPPQSWVDASTEGCGPHRDPAAPIAVQFPGPRSVLGLTKPSLVRTYSPRPLV